jgi:methylmalonyl-CoA mutase N-terminal domain/subunit
VDPLGGSYYIEWLTKKMEEKIVKCMGEVEEKGGMVQAVGSGFIQQQVARQAYLFERGIQNGKIVKIGVNKYVTEESEEYEIQFHPYDAKVQDEQIRRLNEIKSQRDEGLVQKSLEILRDAAQEGKNVMPYLLDSVKEYCTLGEITRIFKEVFGTFKEPIRL